MRGTQNTRAWKAYLKGQREFTVLDKSKMEETLRLFKEATDLDPEFARAWGHRAYAITRSVLEGWTRLGTFNEALSYAKRATDLDRNDYTTFWDLGFVLVNQGKFDEAMIAYKQALKLYKTDTDMLDRKHGLLAEMAEACIFNGDRKQAYKLLENAQQTPDWYRWICGFAYFLDGRHFDAIDEIHRMRSRPGEEGFVPSVCLITAASFAHEGNDIQAKAELAIFKKMHGRKYTLKDAANTGKFRNAADKKHFLTGLKLAGLT